MGLSSKQVSSSRGLDWNQTLLQAQNLELPKASPMKKQQQQNQQSEQLKCPRCDSTNTKFCYYNNYNKSQPRHFCRACKRHWTKGGTLRNVPVGGGRKNKRAKKPATTSNGNSNNMEIQRQNLSLHLEVSDQKNITSSSSLYHQSMIPPLPTISLLPQQNNLISTTRDSEKGKDFDIGNGIFLSSTVPFSQNQNFLFPFSTSNSIDTNPCVVSSSSLRSSNVYNYGEEFKAMEEATINGNMPSSSTSNGTNTQHWEIPATSTAMEMSNYWSWEDLDSLVSTDLNGPWDDSEIKP